jgi:dienelactone hydrolase
MRALLLLGSWVASCPAQAPEDLRSALAAAVDLPDAKARAAAADRLAARADVTLAQWLAAARSLTTFRPAAPGARVEAAELRVAGKVENTELVLWVPKSYDPGKPAPLLVAAHGTGGDGRGEDERWRPAAEQLGMLVVCPSEAGKNEGYAFSDRERDSALAAIRWVRRHYAVDTDRVFLTGISRGGHQAWDLALRWPDLPAAIAPMIGGPRINIAEGQCNLRWLENVAGLSIRDLQGERDDPRLVFNVRLAFDKLKALGANDAVLHAFPERGHGFDFRAVDWPAFLAACRRDPLPRRVVRLASRLDQGRAFWAEILQFEKGVEDEFRPRMTASELAAFEKKSEDDQRRWFLEQAEKRNARLEVERQEPGVFVAKGDKVARFRLLLADGMFVAGKPVTVTWNGKPLTRNIAPSARVLLREFVERFDPAFLPIAEVSLP